MEITSDILAVTLTVGQMHDLIRTCIKEELQAIKPAKEEQAKYLTRVEACEKLHISLPTLTRYGKLGIITAKKVGNRILYIQTDIEKALSDIPTRKLRP